MKKFFTLVIILMVSLVSTSVLAQNEEVVANPSQDPEVTTVVPEVQETTVEADGQSSEEATVTTPLSIDDLQSIITLLDNTTEGKRQNIMSSEGKMFVPLSRNRKFSGHHICQRLELSVLGGKDKSDEAALAELGPLSQSQEQKSSSSNEQSLYDGISEKKAGLNVGANFGYSVVFVPGYQEGDKLLLNRFGFAYSAGVIFQFDNEKKVGVTCDFLGKIGIETGFNKKIGVGGDFLFGGGKTAQMVFDYTYLDLDKPDVDDIIITQESLWCPKIGTQLWIRLNFLTQSVKNFDLSVFTRFIYSFQPYSDEEILHRAEIYDEIPIWQTEAWSFGFTATYFF